MRGNIIYAIVGEEKCPTTVRDRLQGVMRLKVPWTTPRNMRNISKAVHLEIAFGTDEQNRRYCPKSGRYFEMGEIPNENHQRRIHNFRCTADTVASEIIAGENLHEVITKYPGSFLKQGTNMIKLGAMFNRQAARDFKTDIYYYHGKPA